MRSRCVSDYALLSPRVWATEAVEREAIGELLEVTKPEQALQQLGVTEAEFLTGWARFISGKTAPKR